MIRIREATNLDRESIRAVHLSAFPEGENRMVATLADDLLREETSPETFALVAELDDTVAGHIAFSPVTADINEPWNGYILAPLAVKPRYQQRRVGSRLIESGIARLSANGVNVLFVYGDPEYYGKFGFNDDTASGYSPPYRLQYPFGWLAIALNEEGCSGSTVKISCAASLCNPELW